MWLFVTSATGHKNPAGTLKPSTDPDRLELNADPRQWVPDLSQSRWLLPSVGLLVPSSACHSSAPHRRASLLAGWTPSSRPLPVLPPLPAALSWPSSLKSQPTDLAFPPPRSIPALFSSNIPYHDLTHTHVFVQCLPLQDTGPSQAGIFILFTRVPPEHSAGSDRGDAQSNMQSESGKEQWQRNSVVLIMARPPPARGAGPSSSW